ncbi:unnamed protein product, partial [Rotaria sp. Silwood2]
MILRGSETSGSKVLLTLGTTYHSVVSSVRSSPCFM